MKNILWVILLVGFVSVSASAQDDGAKLAKKAKKAITNYFLDPSTKSNLTEELHGRQKGRYILKLLRMKLG